MTFETTTTVTVGELEFDVRSAGPSTGEPVVLLHGFPQSSACWTSVAPLLTARGYRVYAPDQRGYSPAARPTEVAGYATTTLADDVIALADALGLGRFHLVGHDWGSAVAWVVAAHHGERLRSLTAVSLPHLASYGAALRDDPDQQQRAAYIGLLRQVGKAEHVLLEDDARRLRAVYGEAIPVSRVDEYVRRLQEPGALTAALNWYRAMRSDLGALPRIDVPTTFVWSDQDISLARSAALGCAEFVTADFVSRELTGVSHWIPEEAPVALADAIAARLATAR